MKRGLLRVIVIVLAILLTLLFIFFQFGRANATHGHVLVTSSLAETSVTSLLTQATSSQSYVGIEPSVLAALIGAAATLLAALMGGAFIVYQVRKSQSQHNLERDSNRAGVAALFPRKTKRHPKAYRKALLKDVDIATFKILDMSEPLKVSSIYVPIQVHSDPGLPYTLAPELVAAEAQRDPNALFRAEREHLESRARSASDPSEVIRTKTHCIILGDPGAGKTTFLKYLTVKSANKRLPGLPDLPIHIELGTFANSGSIDLLDFAANQWEERYRIPKTKAFAHMVEHLDAGKALLLLDALDETVIGETGDAAEALYKRVVEAIQKVATAYPTSPIVVTARKAGYYQRALRLTAFTELEVLDFRPRDIQRFVDYWFARYTDPQKRIKGKDLKVKLEGNPRIAKLASTLFYFR